jgi:hypothetical protein
MQHVSHFSHLGLIAFDFILLLRSIDNRPGLIPITGTVVSGNSTSRRTIRNSINPKQFSQRINNNNVPKVYKNGGISSLD